MRIEGSVAMVTGANRGLGLAFAHALLDRGAAKVYAGMRHGAALDDPRLTPIRLDVTRAADIADAVRRCDDVDILVNNAGVMLDTPMFATGAADAMRREFNVNVFGMQAMIDGFASILARRGGGAIVNMLSVVSWFTAPFNATYCASKHAALCVSDAARIQLRAQNTRVVGVHAGFIDTDMAAQIDVPKVSPSQVVKRALAGLEQGEDHVLADERAVQVWHDVRADPKRFATMLQDAWDQRRR